MELTFSEPEIFRQLFQCVSRFVDKAHFDIYKRGVRIRSIDPDDFCYVDLHLKKAFFTEYEPKTTKSFGIDISKFSKFLPPLASAKSITILVKEHSLELQAKREWKMVFSVEFLNEDPFGLPEPRRFSYDATAEIGAKEFSNLTSTASTLSSEIILSIHKKKFQVMADSGDYHFSSEPSEILEISNSRNREIAAPVVASYIRALRGLIAKCKKVRINIGEDKPTRLDLIYGNKGRFSFVFSHRRRKLAKRRRASARGGTSLPRLTVTKLPEFLLYLFGFPDGEETRLLRAAGLETAGGDYSRMAKELDLAQRTRGRIKLSTNGEVFVNLVQNDPKQAKTFLHNLAFSKIASYKVMMDSLRRKTLTPEDLYQEINHRLNRKGEYPIDKQDLSTLLGLAIWCGVVDRKLALYYLKKR